ncbi:hypothetical protein [Mycobacterium decipiens]|uniref:TIGR02611 family protein n=1 Tax=Mycobacterium decipiens TaxID=1430326 RepID=A0A1X2LQW5_9MYCO|nr:hypothetical protein [Mycobacterium decipiens]OSC38920.1 hypothetical protein B8W66_18715 [Mycobacterium decipiens]
MDPADVTVPTTSRGAALARVLAYRERGRARPILIRGTLAVVGGGLLVASIPLIVVLPEAGIPAVLVALRLLAIEAEWAARAFAWTDWRFAQLRDWFHRQAPATRAAILIGLFVAAVALVWLLVYEI